MIVSTTDVLAFLGKDEDAGTNGPQLQAHIDAATQMVKAYTRGRGFDPGTGEPTDDMAAVIISCTARQYANPTHTVTTSVDDASVTQGKFNGWTLPELAVLHNYRARAW